MLIETSVRNIPYYKKKIIFVSTVTMKIARIHKLNRIAGLVVGRKNTLYDKNIYLLLIIIILNYIKTNKGNYEHLTSITLYDS